MVELFNRSSKSAVTYCPNLWSWLAALKNKVNNFV